MGLLNPAQHFTIEDRIFSQVTASSNTFSEDFSLRTHTLHEESAGGTHFATKISEEIFLKLEGYQFSISVQQNCDEFVS